MITGANGLLGQTLVKMLGSTGEFNVIATGRGPCRMRSQEGYSYYPLDISQKDPLIACLEKFKPHVVINTAAMTQVDECHKDPENCALVNAEAVGWMSSWCETAKSHFIQVSTDFVFDGLQGPYSEEDVPDPVSVYGQAKLQAEEFVKRSRGPWSIIRTVLVFGLVEDMSRSNLLLWVKNSLEKGERIKVVSDQVRTPTLVDDLATGCALVAQKGKRGIYHISGKDTLSIIDIAKKVARFYQLDESLISPVSSVDLNQAAKRPPVTGFVLDKAQRELGYSPHSFDEMLAVMAIRFKAMGSAF